MYKKRSKNSELGATLVDNGILISLVSIVCLAALVAIPPGIHLALCKVYVQGLDRERAFLEEGQAMTTESMIALGYWNQSNLGCSTMMGALELPMET